jgi:hypothetical protein
MRGPAGTPRAPRWLARLALLVAAAAAVVPLVAVGLRDGVVAILVGVAGLALAVAAGWWFLTHRGCCVGWRPP